MSSKHFNIKVAFVVLLSRAKYSLKDKISTNVVEGLGYLVRESEICHI